MTFREFAADITRAEEEVGETSACARTCCTVISFGLGSARLGVLLSAAYAGHYPSPFHRRRHRRVCACYHRDVATANLHAPTAPSYTSLHRCNCLPRHKNTTGTLALFDRTLHKRHKKLKKEVAVPKLFQTVFKRLKNEPTVRSVSNFVPSSTKFCTKPPHSLSGSTGTLTICPWGRHRVPPVEVRAQCRSFVFW